MPNQQKKILFCMAGVLSFACALGVVAALGTPRWMRATFLCTTGALLVNASGPELDKFTGEVRYGLFHGEGVRQCGLGARPFRFSWSCGCLVMILFASEVKIHHLSEKIANFKEGTFAYRTQSERYTTSFWVVFMCFFVHFLNGLLIRLAGFQFPFAKSKDAETTNVAADLMY
ncbi:clarin-1 isoform X2 [Dipodomys spectabilis]|uniref:clarin-1 isoform X2 n=1 Tax=Dipodomys spectabilis TaxID=105255 RepID=UPI001C536D72|nr:clarin-1 isoform X2 [Dipodomys spectabilis]